VIEYRSGRDDNTANFNMNQPAPLPFPGRIRIVLSHTSHPGNIGAAARAMKTMGLARLVLVHPRQFPHADAVALASGAVDVLDQARVVATLEDALEGCVFVIGMTARKRDLSHPFMALRDAAAQAVAEAQHGEVAIVFGTEMFGLSNTELDRCHVAAGIPANPEYSSLNLAASVQVAAYEIAQAAALWKPAPPRLRQPALHEEVEAFFAHLENSMIESGFLDPQRPKRLMTRLRRLFTRASLEKEEVNILRGILVALERKAHNRIRSE